jgi:hypothetical protein
MKIFDSDKTDRGTIRKKIYIKGSEFNKEAMLQARKDINAEKRSRPVEKAIKPYKQKPYKVYPNENQNHLAIEEKWKIQTGIKNE